MTFEKMQRLLQNLKVVGATNGLITCNANGQFVFEPAEQLRDQDRVGIERRGFIDNRDGTYTHVPVRQQGKKS